MGDQSARATSPDEQVAEVLKSISVIADAIQQRPDDIELADVVGRLESLLPHHAETEQLIRILVQDHPGDSWESIRPMVVWALGVRMGVDAVLLGMILRGEVEVTYPPGLGLTLRTS